MPLTPAIWRTAIAVNTTTTGNQGGFSITQLNNGNIVVSWATDDPSGLGSPAGTEIFAQIFSSVGDKIGGEIRLNQNSINDDEFGAALAAMPDGGFVVTYVDRDFPENGDAANIRLERYDANGNKLAGNFIVVQDSGQAGPPTYSNPIVAVSSATSALITYTKYDGSSEGVFGKTFDPMTSTFGPETQLINTSGDDRRAEITVLGNGNYVVVSDNIDGIFADGRIIYRISNPSGGSVLGSTVVAGTEQGGPTPMNDKYSAVAALAGGGFVIVWGRIDVPFPGFGFNGSGVKEVLGRVYNEAGVETGSFTVTGFAESESYSFVNFVALADGSFVVSYDGLLGGLAMARFSATGGQLGGTVTLGGSTYGSMVGLDDGRFAVVRQDASGEVILDILDTRDEPNAVGVYNPNQWVVGTPGDDVFAPDPAADFVNAGPGNDIVIEAAGRRNYNGGDGADTHIVTSGIDGDVHNGGAGVDTIDWSLSSINADGARFALSNGTATLPGRSETMANFENVIGTNYSDLIFGSAVANVLTAGSGNDAVAGDSGNDTIYGGAGNDALNGDGGYDRAVFDVTRGAATITHNANGTKTITGGGFTDTLSGVEVAQFSDGRLVSLQERTNKADLSADGRSDILLRNSADGSVFVWEVNGTSLGNSGGFGWSPGPVWQGRGTGDFNADGRSDVLLQNSDTGQSFIWFSNGLGSSVSGASGTVGWAPGAQYVARATGDFNGDGRSDILLQDSTNGQCFVFLVNGTGVIGANFVGTPVGAEWVARSTGDFNGDGKSDILFQNANDGTSYIWNIDGTNVIGNGQPGWTPGADWQVRGTGDFNRDGKSDILLQNAVSGQLFTFMVDGTTAINSGFIGSAVGASTVARGTGDFNGDGQSDILFQDINSGAAYVWNLEGTTVASYGQVGWTPGSPWVAFV